MMTNLVWELNPWLSVHEADTLPTELTRFYICQANNKFINLPTHCIMLMTTNEQDLNGSLMHPTDELIILVDFIFNNSYNRTYYFG